MSKRQVVKIKKFKKKQACVDCDRDERFCGHLLLTSRLLYKESIDEAWHLRRADLRAQVFLLESLVSPCRLLNGANK